LFTMIVAMAVITTMAMPPTLRWTLQRLPMRPEEKKRLEREDYEEGAFVPNLERILVAIDGSANARFASRIAGLLAGSRGMPVTVLDVTASAEDKAKEKAKDNGKTKGNGKSKEKEKQKDETDEKAEKEETKEKETEDKNRATQAVEIIKEAAADAAPK